MEKLLGDQGVDRVRKVIRIVKERGFAVIDEHLGCYSKILEPTPVPRKALSKAKLPNGLPLPETWLEWLSFDASWLKAQGWFTSIDPLIFSSKPLAEVARQDHGDEWADYFNVPALKHCFHLPGGGDSRRVLVLSSVPDEVGEHPVFYSDVNGTPMLAALYPGLDVYLGVAAGLTAFNGPEGENYAETAKAPSLLTRNQHHVKQSLHGHWQVEFPNDCL